MRAPDRVLSSPTPRAAQAREPAPRAGGGHRLRLLSYNIQTGLATGQYREYLTKGWRYLLPHADRVRTLHRIANLISTFDIVGLQESDAGSLRTGFVNQTEYLAMHARLPYWYEQVNRRIGSVARHSNGIVSRLRAREVLDCKLPGTPGRGMLMARFGTEHEPLNVFVAHLALGRRGRTRQLELLAEMVNGQRHAIVMGDFNCDLDSPELRALIAATDLRPPVETVRTFPSWRPFRHIDHILVTGGMEIVRSYVPYAMHSDHLPIALEVITPPAVNLHV